jgi:uncharacterized membrane protein
MKLIVTKSFSKKIDKLKSIKIEQIKALIQKIPKSYQQILSEETKKQYFKDIVSFLKSEKKA